MKNLSLSGKMSVIFAILTSVSIAVAAVGMNRISAIQKNVEHASQIGEQLATMYELNSAFTDIIRTEKNTILDLNPANDAMWIKKRDDAYEDFGKKLEKLKGLSNDEEKRTLSVLESKFAPAYESTKKIFEATKSFDANEVLSPSETLETKKMRYAMLLAIRMSMEEGRKLYSDADAVFDDLAKIFRAELTSTEAKSLAAYTTVKWTVILTAVIGISFGIMLAVVVLRSVATEISKVMDGLIAGADKVHAAATQLSETSQTLAEGASEQAASIEETSSSLEEISSMTKNNSDNATNVNEIMSDGKNAAEEGVGKMKNLVVAMDDIKKSSDDIAKIIKVIEEIAFQTNLLALNAAVEAARAGEAGKGFAVVAEEVRNLAQRAATASKDIAGLIQSAVEKANAGSSITGEVSKSLDKLAEQIKKAGELSAEVAAASSEQAQGVAQISRAVTQMDTVTQANAASAEESASASEELSAQAEILNANVRQLGGIVYGADHESSGEAILSSKRMNVSAGAGRPKSLPASRKKLLPPKKA